MKFVKQLSVIALILATAACSQKPLNPIPLEESFYSAPKSIGIYVDKLPNADTFFPGANCLLCLAAASVANSSLTEHVQTLPNEDIASAGKAIEAVAKEKSLTIEQIHTSIDFSALESFSKESVDPKVQYARKDFRPLKQKLNVEQLAIIDINQLGAYRSYNALCSY